MVEVGETAPDFELADSFGKKVRLSDFFGQNVVLYFYPKDDTPGCTIEACSFRDDFETYKKNGIEILGVSLDGEESHQKFSKKYGLPFKLLSDTDAKVSKAFGVFGKKNFFGKKSMGIKRTTFLIGKTGKIMRIFSSVNVNGHSREILEIFQKAGKN
ncbi:MAG: thioredoxin-dependent thiol peroxidase [Candidatus Diapherotrites archaeon]|nr:thioredoxin-dependent thiol peroxidase [Candidatus Diapherotrites archaeon]